MSSEWKYIHVALHHLAVMTQLSGIPILSPLHVGDPFLNVKIFMLCGTHFLAGHFVQAMDCRGRQCVEDSLTFEKCSS